MSADNSIVEVNVYIRLVEPRGINGQRIMAEIKIDANRHYVECWVYMNSNTELSVNGTMSLCDRISLLFNQHLELRG